MSNRKVVTPGVIPAAITPRRNGQHTIDLSATLELIGFLGEHGVDGILLLGSTGEFINYELQDRTRMVSMSVKRSRVPLLVNVSHPTLDGAVLLAQEAADAGAAAVLLLPPYYFRYGQDVIHEFFLRFAEPIAKLVPIYLYNIPRCTNELAAETAVRLLSTGIFAGIKDSCGQWPYLETVLREQAGHGHTWQVFTGDESLLLRARAAGGAGTISGAANAIPELLAALNRAFESNHQAHAERLNAYVLEFLSWLDKAPRPVITREATKLRGIDAGSHAVPLGETVERAVSEFRNWFQEWWPGALKASNGYSTQSNEP